MADRFAMLHYVKLTGNAQPHYDVDNKYRKRCGMLFEWRQKIRFWVKVVISHYFQGGEIDVPAP